LANVVLGGEGFTVSFPSSFCYKGEVIVLVVGYHPSHLIQILSNSPFATQSTTPCVRPSAPEWIASISHCEGLGF
jgi:hypothetical protein